MKMCDIHVGDKLRFRQAKEIRNDPQVGFAFVSDMEYLCGQNFTVKSIDGARLYSVEEIERHPVSRFRFSISAQMLEPALPELVSLGDAKIENIMFE